jgi:adenylate cyclase
MERRLAAVLAFDMVGYSRLIGVDERGTLAAFDLHLGTIFNPRARQYGGRIVKTTGDGALVEFPSVVESIHFAIEVQADLERDNAGREPDRQFLYRIGINIGDIVLKDGDIYGDGVNIASRLQELAEPGGICLAGSALEHVRGKLDLSIQSLGVKQVKNIAEPVSVYAVALDEKARALITPAMPTASPGRARSGRLVAVAAATLVVLVAAIAGALFWNFHEAGPPEPQRFAYPLPDKPSIAVLPFINLGNDGEQDHLSMGLTDDLITELSKVGGLFVIARHSVFALEDTVRNIREVATELGVRFVLEGSLQRNDSRVRINVSLIDALSGSSVWSERYDRQFADIFAVRDDVVRHIISALAVKLSAGENELLAQLPTENLEAYDYYLRAEKEGFLYSDVQTYRRSLSFYQRAIDLDPRFAAAHAGIARVAVDVWRNDYNQLWSAAVARKIAYDAAGEALRLDPKNARAHSVLALIQLVDGRYAEAIDSANRAVTAQPNDAEAVGNLALVLAHTGDREAAKREIESALRFDPAPSPNFQLLAGVTLYTARENERAIALLEAARKQLTDNEPVVEYLAAAYAHQDKLEAAAKSAAELLKLFPDTNLTYYTYLYDYWREEDRQHHLDGLQRAGLTQWPFGFEGSKADLLAGQQLQDIVTDRNWIGKHKNGTEFFQYFDSAGNTAYRSEHTNITGMVEVREDRLCENFTGYFMNRWACGHVYRNRGDYAPDLTYVHVSPLSLKFFSPQKP